jgi:hypothetical protein
MDDFRDIVAERNQLRRVLERLVEIWPNDGKKAGWTARWGTALDDAREVLARRSVVPVPGCDACEHRWDEEQGYLRSLEGDAALPPLRPPLVQVTIDVRANLCPAHRAQLHALLGPER